MTRPVSAGRTCVVDPFGKIRFRSFYLHVQASKEMEAHRTDLPSSTDMHKPLEVSFRFSASELMTWQAEVAPRETCRARLAKGSSRKLTRVTLVLEFVFFRQHDGKTVDGGHDSRVDSDHGFGGDHDLAVEAGRKGGKAGTMEQTAERYGGDFATSAEQAE